LAYPKKLWNIIRGEFENGANIVSLAQKHGMHPDTIRKRRDKKKWKINKGVIPKRSVFNVGWSPLEIMEQIKKDDEYEGKLLQIVKYAMVAVAAGETATVETNIYDDDGKLLQRVTLKPPTPSALNNLVMIDERIGLLGVNSNAYETDEEKEERYLAYLSQTKEDREYYNTRDIEKALEIFDSKDDDEELKEFHITNFLKNG